MIAFANFVLFTWPLVVLTLLKRKPVDVAIILTILVGILILPSDLGFDLPLLPEIDKEILPSLSAVIILLIMGKSILRTDAVVLPGWLPRSKVALSLIVLLIVSSFLTVMTNDDVLVYGPRVLPALRLYDAFSFTVDLLVFILPLLLARKFLAHPESHKTLLIILSIAMLWYSLPTLYEVRMSPQINRMFYGFFPQDWRQHIRAGGFRPIVFMDHGLVLGLFLCMAILSSIMLFRMEKDNKKALYLAGTVWLIFTLVLAKTLGALMIALVLIPAAFLFGIRLQMITAAIIAGIVLTYPAVRGAGYVPTENIVAFSADISQERADSLAFRFRHEDALLDKANERPLFGWGGWGRSRVFDDRGRNTSVTDGAWIISVGHGGWIRYVGEYGLLCISVILLAIRQRKYEIGMATSGLCLVLVANLIDLLPNAGITPLTWIMAGALMGRLELQTIQKTSATAADPEQERRLRYSRATDTAIPAAPPKGAVYTRKARSEDLDAAQTAPSSADTTPIYRRNTPIRQRKT